MYAAPVLERAELRIELELRPFSFTIRRSGKRVMRAGGVWVAGGTSADHFVQMTEGVIPVEQLEPPERALRAAVTGASGDEIELLLTLDGGRTVRLSIAISEHQRISLTLTADGAAARTAIEWDRRSEERYTGLGARHSPQFDQGGR